MPRGLRLEYPGGTYHVIQRGNNKEHIFREKELKGYFLKQLRLFREGLGFTLYGYVIMDNHYHLLLKTGEYPLPRVMSLLNSKYGRYYNWKTGRSGHVFQGRYKSLVVSDEKYLLAVLRYIHQNPVRAGLSKEVKEYRWSSDFFYRRGYSNFVDVNLILGILSLDRRSAVKIYDAVMNEEENKSFTIGRIIGEIGPGKGLEEDVRPGKRETLDEILRNAAASEEDFNLIKSGSRQRSLTGMKLAYAMKAVDKGYTLQCIGENISMTGVAVHDLLKRHKKQGK